jgi:hypothetical protein
VTIQTQHGNELLQIESAKLKVSVFRDINNNTIYILKEIILPIVGNKNKIAVLEFVNIGVQSYFDIVESKIQAIAQRLLGRQLLYYMYNDTKLQY